MMAEGAEIQVAMFEAVSAVGGEGVPEIELVAAAAVSRAAGFGGNVQMRRFPLQCDRGVNWGRGVQEVYLHSSILQLEAQDLIQWLQWEVVLQKIKANEPVLVDLVHLHR